MKQHHSIQRGREASAMFPEQTKSIPAMLIWLVVFVVDVVLVFYLADRLGIPILELTYHLRSVLVMLYVAVAGLLFWLEAFVYNKIIALFR